MSRRRRFATNLVAGAQEGTQPSKISRGLSVGGHGPFKRPARRPVYRRLAK